MTPSAIDFIRRALSEDRGDGDITSRCFIEEKHLSSASIVARESSILAGIEVAAEVFRQTDSSLVIEPKKKDGDCLAAGDEVLVISGRTRSLLAAERTALNFLQRLSGIATLTRRFVEATDGTKARILDTRKTTPGLREFERLAVRAGGGDNHRFGLFDRVLAKDNHLAVAGDANSIQLAINKALRLRPHIGIQIEADTLDQVRMLCELRGIDSILLDNMSNAQLCEAVAIRGTKGILLEASGGVTLETVASIAATGVDRISVGALTHSARAADFAMDIHAV